MEECDICLTKIKKRYKNKHEQPKKHKYFSNLIINKYIVRNDEIDNFKDTFRSYCDKHKKKFDKFTVWVFCKLNDEKVDEVKVPNSLIREKRYKTSHDVVGMPLIFIGPCVDYLDSFYFDNEFFDERNIIFISDLKDITFFHYMEQPRSVLVRKIIKKHLEEQRGDLDYNWLPNCFRQINT